MDLFKRALSLALHLGDDLAGELLRQAAFTDEGYGAYDNFNLREGWLAFPPESLTLHDRTLLLGCFAKESDEVARINAYVHQPTMALVQWHWNGDGTLLFRTRHNVWVNNDCKKSRGWERNPVWVIDCLNDEKYYA